MKKFLLIASAFLALVACNKEPIETPVQKEGPSVLTFRSEKPQLDPSTKTEWNGTTIIWSSGDQMRVGYTFNGNWMGQSTAGVPKFYVSNEVAIDGSNSSIGTFSVPAGEGSGQFVDPGEGSYVFYSFFPKSAGESSAVSSDGIATLTLPDSQTPVASSFDKSADIMIGKTASLSLEGLPEDPIEISWSRVVAHADLTFSNLAFDGTEKVSKITLTSSGKLAGTFTVNLVDGTVSAGDDAVNSIIIKGDNLTVNGNSVEAWCGVLPGEFTSIGVVIKTDKATYTKNINGISGKAFKKNARNTLTINMSGAARTEVPADNYSLYSGGLTEGDYLIVYDNSAMKAEVESDRLQYKAVAPSDDVISTNDASIVWHIAPSGDYWTIKNASENKYAASTGAKNKAQLLDSGTDDMSLWTASGTSSFDFVNKKNSSNSVNATLRKNGTYGFACYGTTTGGKLSLYKKDTRQALDAPATVSASLNDDCPNAIDVYFSTVSGAASYVITATPISETGSVVTVSDVTESPKTIENLAYNASYAISVYAVPSDTDNYKNSSATEAAEPVTTGQAPVTTIADVIAGGAGNYEVPNVLVYATKGNALILGDETGRIYAYKSDHGLTSGAVRTVSGETTVTSAGIYEFNNPTFSGTGTATVNHGTAAELDNIASTLKTEFASPHSAVYVHAIGTIEGRNITTVGENVLYLFGTEDVADGKDVEVYGYVYHYSSGYKNFNFLVTSIEEYIDENAPSLSVSPTSATWASGENDEKTFTITPTNGNWDISSETVSSWATIVKDIEGNTIKVTPKTAQASATYDGTITITLIPSNAGYENKTATINLTQAMSLGTGTWTLVTDASTLSAGDIIVFAAYKATYNASGSSYTDNKVMGPISNSLGTAIDVTFSGDGTTIPSLPSNAQQYVLGGTSGAWTIMNGSKYLTQGDKKLTEGNSAHTWTISISSNNATVTSVFSSSYKLQYNPNSGKGRFATYSSSQKPIRIYRYE